jgi:Mg2+/Co2+ transporter CorB
MSLNQNFKEALSELSTSVSALRLDERYRVTHARRLGTCHGMRVVLKLLEKDDRVVSVFLPKRYGDAMADADITDINTGHLQYHLIYSGKSSVSAALLVDIEL